MPELPEVEAWVRELDPLVSFSPVERAGPAHVATLKTAAGDIQPKVETHLAKIKAIKDKL